MKKIYILVPVLLAAACSKDSSAVGSMELSPSSLEICIGESYDMVVEIEPESAAPALEWVSDDTDVVSVDEGGRITANGIGVATVTVFAGELSASAVVNVTDIRVEELVLETEYLVIKAGGKARIDVRIAPQDYVSAIKWESDNPAVVTVESGEVHALSAGYAEISVKAGDCSAVCPVTVVDEPGIGDYLYSDGSWLDYFEERKQLAGIVFWTGNPSGNDPVLARDHAGCVNGLAVALNDEACMWQGNYPRLASSVSGWAAGNMSGFLGFCVSEDADAADNVQGYNNTAAIEAFNADAGNHDMRADIARRLAFFNADPANRVSPATSGWYVPSAKELSLLCSGDVASGIMDLAEPDVDVRNIVNERIILCGTGLPVQESPYWSSTEYDKDNALVVEFETGFVRQYVKNMGNVRLRFVLAF